MRSLFFVANRILPKAVTHKVATLYTGLAQRTVRVEHQSSWANVLHCCVQKTASRWLRRILLDREVVRYSGLRHTEIPGLKGGYQQILPKRAIIGPIYNIFPRDVAALQTTDPTFAFFVVRDPRDVIVSWYYSMKESHVSAGTNFEGVSRMRTDLNSLSKEEGLCYAIDRHKQKFEIYRAWMNMQSPCMHLVRFEDLTGPDAFSAFRELFDAMDIRMPDERLQKLLETYSFENMAGRTKGQEVRSAHLRKGIAGDWENHFTEDVHEYFNHAAGDIVQHLGYQNGSAKD